MAIFSNRSFTGSTVDYPNMAPTMESVSDMVMESQLSAASLVEALYVSDIIIEEKVLTEGANAEVLVEATVKELFKKFIDALVRLKNKIVAWFKKLWENIKIRFTHNKNFVKKYEKQIKAAGKNTKKTTLMGYVYETEKAEAAFNDATVAAQAIVSVASKSAAEKFDEAKEKFLNRVSDKVEASGTTVSDLKSGMMQLGKSAKKESHEMTSAYVNKLVTVVLAQEKTLKRIEETKKSALKTIEAAIKSAQKASNEKDKEGKSTQAQISALNTATSVITSLAAVVAKLVDAESKQYSSMLKAVLLGRKESTELAAEVVMDEETTDEEIDELVENAIETVGQEEPEAVMADEDVEDQMEDVMDEEVVATDIENPDSVLAEALSFVKF